MDAKDRYDHRGLSYRDYVQHCGWKGLDPLPPEEAARLSESRGRLDWELSAALQAKQTE